MPPADESVVYCMANLMITYRCNLNCSYCFANSYVNREDTDMTLDTAGRMLDWLCQGGERMVGVMGGEPTVHRHLPEILKMIHARGMHASLFTNGLALGQHLPLLREMGVRILLNVNEPEVLGSMRQAQLEQVLTQLLDMGMAQQVTFGVNIYKQGYDYRHIIEMMKRFHHHELRVSVTVPTDAQAQVNPLDYLRAFIPDVVRLLRELHAINAYPTFDCNRIPACLLCGPEFDALPDIHELVRRTNLFRGAEPCSPVLDILPDETAIRCFGLSDETRVRVADFHTPRHLRQYYRQQMDALCAYLPVSDNCRSCYEQRTGLCHGGCLVFRMEQIKQLRELLAANEEGILHE